MNLNYPKNRSGMYILHGSDLENIAYSVVKKHFPINLEYPRPCDTQQLLEEFGLMEKCAFLGIPGHEILGATIMGDSGEIVACDLMMTPIVLNETYGTVLIHSNLCCAKNAPRKKYTEAHELAHWVLHQDYFDSAKVYKRVGSPNCIACRTVENYKLEKKTEHDWLEWQADTLAAAILMPKFIFFDYAKSELKKAGAFSGFLAEGNPDDKRIFYEAIDSISHRFGVSHRAAQIRMIHLGLICTTR